jgi:hypothetical protein
MTVCVMWLKNKKFAFILNYLLACTIPLAFITLMIKYLYVKRMDI